MRVHQSNCCVFVTFLYQTRPVGTQKESTTIPPDPRGDASGPGVDEVVLYDGTEAFKLIILFIYMHTYTLVCISQMLIDC